MNASAGHEDRGGQIGRETFAGIHSRYLARHRHLHPSLPLAPKLRPNDRTGDCLVIFLMGGPGDVLFQRGQPGLRDKHHMMVRQHLSHPVPMGFRVTAK